jgi:putative hemin transport protein
MMNVTMPSARDASCAGLKEAWENLDCSLRKLRSSDAASKLGVSEGELIGSLCGTRALRLRNVPADLIRDVPALGPVTAVTRNAHCLHEKTGPYRNFSIEGTTGLVMGKEIDLRLFLRQWQHAFAVFEMSDCGPRRSLQFFDAQGCAVHKIFQHAASDSDAFDIFVSRWRSGDQTPHMATVAAPEKKRERADAEIDQNGLRTAWLALEDTHDFFGLLQRFGVGRQQALRLGGEDLARPLDGQAAERLFNAAKADALPVMVFVGNSGCIQIHTGPINALTSIGPWLNAAGENFRLHLRQDMIATAYAVRKPTKDGDVHSLELFDASGFCFAQIFGARKPGKPELAAWRDLITQV